MVTISFGLGLAATIRGGSGSDFIVGGAENDILYGGDGDDFIEGLAGGDRIFGDNGNDRLSGGAGDDPLIRGGNGDDLLSGGIGRDRLIGEVGTDEAYREMNESSSVDIFVSAETINNVATATSGPLDAGETYLGNLIDRFWADTSPSDAFNDTLDEIIGQILP